MPDVAPRAGNGADGPAERFAGPSPVAAPGRSGPRRSRRPAEPARSVGPLHVVLAIGAFATFRLAGPAVDDLDAYWHVEIGREILRTHRVSGLGQGWLAVPAPDWRTSQWLAEVAMALAVDAAGWRALVVGRFLLVAALLTVLAVTLLPRRPVAVTAPVGCCVLVALLGGVQTRPQSVSLLFVALLGAACVRLWTDGRRPPLLAVCAASLLWAQLHGLWVLGPVAFGLVAVGARLDGDSARGVARSAALSALAALSGVLNPWGPVSFLLPLRLRAAASPFIAEWGRTTLDQSFTLAWAALVLLLVAGWLRSPGRVPRVEVVWALAWVAFGATAYRNVVVSVLLLAPAAVAAVDRAWGEAARRRSTPSRLWEGRLLLGGVAGVLAITAVTSWLRVAAADPLADAPARRIAERLATSPTPVRVLNGYNASGVLVALGGGRVRLVVDGRADLWGQEYVERLTGVQNLAEGWEAELTALRPDAVVLPRTAPLVTLLEREGHWRRALRDGDYVLLLPAG
jgi:hypothetical protein